MPPFQLRRRLTRSGSGEQLPPFFEAVPEQEKMTPKRVFSKPILTAIDEGKIVGIRAGLREHRFIGIWAVVVEGRIFVRPWNDKPDGWYRVFLEEPRGTLQVGDREVRVRARRVRSERLMDAVDRAYAEKYNTPGSRHYVRGFARPRRRRTTTELLPR